MKIFMVYTCIVHRTFSAICRPLAAPYPPQIHKSLSDFGTQVIRVWGYCAICALSPLLMWNPKSRHYIFLGFWEVSLMASEALENESQYFVSWNRCPTLLLVTEESLLIQEILKSIHPKEPDCVAGLGNQGPGRSLAPPQTPNSEQSQENQLE